MSSMRCSNTARLFDRNTAHRCIHLFVALLYSAANTPDEFITAFRCSHRTELYQIFAWIGA